MSNNTLTYRHIKEPTIEILRYIDDRRKGVNKSLKTKWDKFNRHTLGGLEPNSLITIAGISGSGKSSFANSLEVDLFDLNPDVNFMVLSFSFEMLSSRQIGRKLSYRLKKTTNELYSSNVKGSVVNNKDYEKIVAHSEQLMKYPIYYVDSPGTVEEISNTIKLFQEKAKQENKRLVVILDHTLLTKGKQGASERETLYMLQRAFIEAKKVGMTTIIQLSQMNRNIESNERINNPSLHYPMRNDLFGSDSVYQASDLVLVLHRPEILGIKAYGPNHLPTKEMIYAHIVKNREGEPIILSFKNNLKYNSIEEINPLDLKKERNINE